MEGILGNTRNVGIEGFWGEKTSSVNFCEKDFVWSPFIAEFHNTWTSLFLILIPLIGLLYSNPTHEWCFTLSYLQLIVVYIGSVTLHMTLTSWGQAADELPMLWMCTVLCNALLQTNSKRDSAGFIGWTVFCLAFALIQSIIYVRIQSLYHVFVFSYLSMVAFIMSWTAYLSWNGEKSHMPLRQWLWLRSFGTYVVLGSSTWLIDMHFCEELTPLQDLLGGVTFHILWHFGAAYATYCMINLIIVMRLQFLGIVPEIQYRYYIPVVSISQRRE